MMNKRRWKVFLLGDFLYLIFCSDESHSQYNFNVTFSTESLKSWKNWTFHWYYTVTTVNILINSSGSRQPKDWRQNRGQKWTTLGTPNKQPQASFSLRLCAAMVFFMCINRSDRTSFISLYPEPEQTCWIHWRSVKKLVLVQPADVRLRYICFQLIAVIQGKNPVKSQHWVVKHCSSNPQISTLG